MSLLPQTRRGWLLLCGFCAVAGVALGLLIADALIWLALRGAGW